MVFVLFFSTISMQGNGQRDCEETAYSPSLMLCNVSLATVGYAKLTLTYMMSNWKAEKYENTSS